MFFWWWLRIGLLVFSLSVFPLMGRENSEDSYKMVVNTTAASTTIPTSTSFLLADPVSIASVCFFPPAVFSILMQCMSTYYFLCNLDIIK
ncbi:hypothetical protein HD806DRAFT_507727 [Xylariaceae sp. AK1471]|nr:hypothetical protein HD806DRAFT_507727 [Xylariaceae sp. AK1471]